jgi:polar amino acid transport system substrate-binding protein
MTRILVAALAAALLAGCASAPKPPGADLALPRAELAPTGKLRAAINLGNPVLASRGKPGELQGVSVDLARELGRRLGVPVELLPFDSAGKTVEAGKAGLWDIAFVALDPARAAEIAQSPPYVVIEGAYLVRQDSPMKSNGDVDRAGNRIVVGRGSAYDLYLTRTIKQATIERVPTSGEVVSTFLQRRLEVAAGVKQQLEMDIRHAPGVRLLPGRFMVINQAMASQRGKDAGARFVRDFIEDAKASGFVATALERHRIQGAAVAPAGDAQ